MDYFGLNKKFCALKKALLHTNAALSDLEAELG
jgi:hypothetical protein